MRKDPKLGDLQNVDIRVDVRQLTADALQRIERRKRPSGGEGRPRGRGTGVLLEAVRTFRSVVAETFRRRVHWRPMTPKICVYGAGAIGLHIAGHLARAGRADVSVVDREHNITPIRERGIRVITPTEEFTTRVNATTDPSTLGVQDFVIVTLKIQQATDALDDISRLVGPDTAVVPPATGIPYYFFHGLAGRYDDTRLPEIDPDGRQWRTVPPHQVLPMVFWVGAHRLEPGVTQQDGDGGRYPLGELDGSDSDRARRLSELLTAGGLAAPITDDIRGEIWIKFANSLCGNPIAVLTLADMNGFASSPAVVSLFETMLGEVDAIGDALGVSIPQSIAERMTFTLGTGEHKFSMLQDLESGKPLEIDAFAQSLAAVKRVSGLRTPTCDVVLALAELRDAAHQAEVSPSRGPRGG
jgi:2-dehydropantoate 2-reductase